MREIVLVRHGIPVCDRDTRIRGSDFAERVRKYENASLDRRHGPPVNVQSRISEMGCVVTSTLSRSIESAAILVPGWRTLSDALFNEAGIPTAIPFQVSLAAAAATRDVRARTGPLESTFRIPRLAGWSTLRL